MQTWVNEETAKQLPNRTLAVPDLSDRYIIQLDVFHQLHCLDVIRGLLWPERYKHKSPSGYYLPSGERNYTSSAANHYGNIVQFSCILSCAEGYDRSLLRVPQAISDVPQRHKCGIL